MRSIVFSVPLRGDGMELTMQEAERLVGPLSGLYGKSKKLLGLEAIKVWIQTTAEGATLNIYLESRGPIAETLETGRASTHPLDNELRRLFETVTGQTWDDVVGQSVVQILDWRAGADDVDVDEEQSS